MALVAATLVKLGLGEGGGIPALEFFFLFAVAGGSFVVSNLSMLDSLESFPTFLAEEEEAEGAGSFSVDRSLDNFLTLPFCFVVSDDIEVLLDVAGFAMEEALVGECKPVGRVGLVESLLNFVGLVTSFDLTEFGAGCAVGVAEVALNRVGLVMSLVGLVIDCTAEGILLSFPTFVGLKQASLGAPNAGSFLGEVA